MKTSIYAPLAIPQIGIHIGVKMEKPVALRLYYARIIDISAVKMVKIKVKVIPGAKKTGISGWMEGEILKIHIAEKPEAGKANDALVRLLAKTFEMRKEDVLIQSGLRGRNKTILLKGVDASQVRIKLADCSGQDP